jgi:predicted Fe-Mo cluster-binding NifX family protein
MEKGWKEIFMTAHEYKATMAKDILENKGIKTVILNQHDSSYKTFGEFAVYVMEADYERASEFLKNLKN